MLHLLVDSTEYAKMHSELNFLVIPTRLFHLRLSCSFKNVVIL